MLVIYGFMVINGDEYCVVKTMPSTTHDWEW
jgi:hypothetical protein